MRQNITNYIKAGYPGIYIVSSEEARVESELKSIAASLKHRLYAWSVTEGLIDTGDGKIQDVHDPVDVMALIEELPEDSVCLLRDLHLYLQDANPVLVRAMKDCLRSAKTKGRTLVIAGCRFNLPPELEREFVIVEFRLPGKDQLAVILDGIAESARKKKPQGDAREDVVNSACGMTSIEAENAYALSVIEVGGFSPAVIAREKAQTVKKNGLLEIHQASGSLDQIGGLGLLKDWLIKRKDAFGRKAVEYGLPSPKGLLIIGLPGTGKSLTAKATASVFNRPLIRLDAGRLFAGLVGQSEGNLRSVIQTVEAIAPCVLWVDEVEKGFSGSKSSGQTDGGTSSRVFGTFISWMQERTAPVFIVATANDVTQLPPELLRKGRLDEIFFVDLPNQQEREIIWGIQIAKYGRDPKKYALTQLAKITDGLTGSEIEQAFIDGLYQAFSVNQEPTDRTLQSVLTDLVPLSKLMGEQINALRKWAKGRARPATACEVEDNRAARMGRNPATGETIKIKAKVVLKFRIAKAAKDAVLAKK